MNNEDWSQHLHLVKDGFWSSNSTEVLSYPEDSYQACFEIEDKSFWFAHRNGVLSTILKRFPPGGPLLDIGAGNGYVSAGLAASGFKSVPLEPHPVGAENAYRRGLRPVLRSTLEEAGFKPGSISAAGMFDVLEHLPNDGVFLEHLRPLLKPGGRLYLTVPAHPFLWSDEDVYAKHFRRYTASALSRTLINAGYSVEYSGHFFAPLIPFIFLSRVVPHHLGFRNKNHLGKVQREHRMARGPIRWAWDALGNIELSLIKKRRLPFGASCIAVGKAP